MKKTKKFLKLSQIYSYVAEEDCYLVQISLDNYEEIFNAWDAAPVKRRDLETDLLHFLETVAYDLPMSENLKLIFQLPEEMKDESKELASSEGVYHNFRMINHFINIELSKNNRKIMTYLFFGLGFLSLSFFFQHTVVLNFPFSMIIEGFFIGGWVMFWEAFSLFFFSGSELRSRRKRYTRYLNSKIEFKY